MNKNHVTLIVTATIAFTLAVFALTVWALVSKNDKKSDMKGNSSKPDVPAVNSLLICWAKEMKTDTASSIRTFPSGTIWIILPLPITAIYIKQKLVQ